MRRGYALATTAALALGVLVAATAAWASGSSSRVVQMLDACDGPSFNAALQDPEACVRNGGVTFDKFVGQLLENGEAPAWRFSPETMRLDAGGTITAVNRGGEAHTFSEVAQFGGGCIEEVNDLLELTAVPECANFPAPPGGPFFGSTLAPPGGSVTTAPLGAGTHRFLCLIHPWMRTTATVD